MGDAVKRIRFEAVKDSKTFKDLEKSMSDLSFKWSDDIKTEIKQVEQLQYEIKELNQQFEAIEDLKGEKFDELRKSLLEEKKNREKELNGLTGRKKMLEDEKEEEKKLLAEELKREKDKEEAQKKIADDAAIKFQNLSNDALKALKGIFEDAWAELENITNFSRLSSKTTRDLVFSYGFNSSQAYGYSQAMSMMKFESEEDLLYATTDEIIQFKELFNKYTDWYSEQGSEELQLYRDFEIELAEFKQDMKLTVVDFFMDNKDDIKRLIAFSFEFGTFMMDSLGWILKYFGGQTARSASQKSADSADIIRNYSNTSTVNNNNFNNVFNVSGPNASRQVADDMLLGLQMAIKA